MSSTVTAARTNGVPVRVLSARQLEVLTLIAHGLSTNGIAGELVVSPATVRAHVRNILDALCAHNRAHAVAIACTAGLIRLDDER
jgi:DNA-binding NarL/FixJ family response regulator